MITSFRQLGFSLVEMAIVLVISGILLGALLVPITAQMELRGYSATSTRLEEIKEALIGYAIINGRLPCPAVGANGLESFAGGGNATNGNCSPVNGVFSGFLPASTLGISPQNNQGFATDAWGGNDINRIRYTVSNQTVNTIANPFTTTNGMKNVGVSNFSGANLLYVCASKPTTTAPHTACTGVTSLTTNAAFVVYSVGKNASTGGTSTDEAVNPNPNNPNTNNDDVVFVSHEPTSTYDDTLVWTSISELVNKMVQAGQLP